MGCNNLKSFDFGNPDDSENSDRCRRQMTLPESLLELQLEPQFEFLVADKKCALQISLNHLKRKIIWALIFCSNSQPRQFALSKP